MPSILRTLLLPFFAMVFCISKAVVLLKGILNVFGGRLFNSNDKFLKVTNLMEWSFINRLTPFVITLLFGNLFIANNAISQTQKFDAPGTHSFTVPSGVTKITIEAWGGGGVGDLRSVCVKLMYAVRVQGMNILVRAAQ